MTNQKKEEIISYPVLEQTEFSIISLMLKHKDNIDVVLSNNVNENTFYNTNCRNVFKAIHYLKTSNAYINVNTVYDRLNLTKVNINFDSLVTLSSVKIDHSDSIPELCKSLKDFEKQRDLIEVSNQITTIVNRVGTLDEKLELTANALNSVIKEQMDNIYLAKSSYNNVLDSIKENIERKGKNNMSWGFYELDLTLGGIHTGLHIIGARPGVGKTSLVDQVIDSNAEDGKSTLFFSCEMNFNELVYRKIQRELGIDINRIRRGDIFEHEMLLIENFEHSLNDNVVICDSSNLEISRLKSIAKIKFKQNNIKMIVIDYLQLLKCSSKKNRYDEITEISMQLKALSKELNIPVIALSQLNRNVTSRESGSGQPNLSDLRESGQIEQDADSVMFIHRPSLLDKTHPKLSDGTEHCKIIIAKNRFGRTEERNLKFNGQRVKFEEMGNEPIPSDVIEAFESNKKTIKFKS